MRGAGYRNTRDGGTGTHAANAGLTTPLAAALHRHEGDLQEARRLYVVTSWAWRVDLCELVSTAERRGDVDRQYSQALPFE